MIFNAQAQPSSSRGALIYRNYCSGCHTLRYMRYEQMMSDLDLWKTKQDFNFSQTALSKKNAIQWFGRMPPDLSLIARERGYQWLIAYLQGFYADPHKAFGANNLQIPDVNMPNVLYPLQATLNQEQFTQTTQDIVSFLDYVSEPEKSIRYKLGFFVISFLLILAFLVYFLFISARSIKI